ncbi:uncharacterized protein LOC132742924 [Ruditapes philippinarum]|uniref:uncharacterized protein LOC132742924 n=1 Tax=Ruditapes philippinarum TaxID=129788 RepID=UPI00295B7C8D|nr:uncharacterized protein LOC132742924 [Ruditapes philippinarum]
MYTFDISVLGVEITLKSDIHRSELIDKARYILKKAFECAEKKAGTSEYTQVVKAVEELFDEVERLGDVKILPPEFKCINMYIRCTTCTGLYRLLRYIKSDAFENRLQKIVAAVKEEMAAKVSTYSLISRFIPKCLNEILKTITETESTYMCKVELPIEVRSCDGIVRVDHWIGSGQAQKSLNAISETISSELGATIAMEPSLNVKTITVTPESTRISTFISQIPGINLSMNL